MAQEAYSKTAEKLEARESEQRESLSTSPRTPAITEQARGLDKRRLSDGSTRRTSNEGWSLTLYIKCTPASYSMRLFCRRSRKHCSYAIKAELDGLAGSAAKRISKAGRLSMALVELSLAFSALSKSRSHLQP